LGNSSEKVGRRVLHAGGLLAAARLTIRTIDLVRMLTIARWLGPAEMGIYAVAAVVLNALDQFSETGLHNALIQRQGDISRYILPVRTFQAVRGIFLGLLVFLIAPWMASFFNSPNSLSILRIMAVFPIIRGFEPLLFTLAQKEIRFAPIIAVQTSASIISLAVGLIAAYIRPDAWALVLSSISMALVTTVGAHLLSERPTLGFSFNWGPIRDLRNFGFWIFIIVMVSYIFVNGGQWVIGRVLDVKALAVYQIAFLICTLATKEIGQILTRLSLPVFSMLQNDKSRLENAFRQSFGMISIATFAMAGFVIACSADFYRLALGDKWLGALPLVPWLTAWGVCSVFAGCLSGLFQALGRPKLWAQQVFIMTIILAIGIYPLAIWLGALGVAMLMACIGVIMQLIRYWIVSRLLEIPLKNVFLHVLVPSLACIISIVTTNWIRVSLPISSHLFGLILTIIGVATIYTVVLFIGQRWMEPSPRELYQRIRELFNRNKAAIDTVTEVVL